MPCHWHRDEDGATTLIPGCWSRAHDPDAVCLCGRWSEETAAEEISGWQAHNRRQREAIEVLRRALKAAGVPDPTIQIDMTVYNARQRRRAMHKAISAAGGNEE